MRTDITYLVQNYKIVVGELNIATEGLSGVEKNERKNF